MSITSVAAALPALFLIAACAAAPPSPVPTEQAPTAAPTAVIEHPTGATEVVLRMHRVGGFLWPGTVIDREPTFTLYGDGTVVYAADEATGGNDPRRGLRVARMDEAQMAALITAALGPGGLAQAADSYDDVPVADATTINFTVNAAGFDKSVRVYALDDGLDEPGPETADRERFLQLYELLASFEDEVARGSATAVGEFQPEAYRVTLFPDEFGELQVTGEWPWDDLEPADFETDQGPFPVATLDQDRIDELVQVEAGDMGDPVVLGPDGGLYLIRFRPLLPDEIE